MLLKHSNGQACDLGQHAVDHLLKYLTQHLRVWGLHALLSRHANPLVLDVCMPHQTPTYLLRVYTPMSTKLVRPPSLLSTSRAPGLEQCWPWCSRCSSTQRANRPA